MTSRSQANRITRLARELRHGAMGARPQPFPQGSNRLVTSCRPLYPRRTDCSIFRTSLFSAGLQRRQGRQNDTITLHHGHQLCAPARVVRIVVRRGCQFRLEYRGCTAPPQVKEVTVDPSTTALVLLEIMKGGCTACPRCVQSHIDVFLGACAPSNPKPNAATRVINAPTGSSSSSALWSIVERSLTGNRCARNEVDAHRAR